MDDIIREPAGAASARDPEPFRVAIIGGGLGGLFTAWHLAARAGLSCQITIYEANSRLGGQLETLKFAGVGPYEAGVAEIYDYSRVGPDPLHDLIVKELGLKIKYIRGGPCVLNGKIVLETNDLATLFSEKARDEAVAFRQRCMDLLSPESYYLAVAEEDNAHPWAQVRGSDLLEREFTDDVARRYIRAMAHSDVAADPHQTNGLTFLKNVLMDVEGYIDLCSVVGGNDQIVTRLAEELDAKMRLNANVTAVEPLADGTFRIEIQANGDEERAIADYVVAALPLSALSSIHWRSEALEFAVDKHVGYFDRPGAYIRATFLFQHPFWRDKISTNWWMLDAFDGCCVYDEGTRNDYGPYGMLAFLIAGNAALELTNDSDELIAQMCLDALPAELAHGKELLLDRRIHRWVASVSAIPGGVPVRPRAVNHRPDPFHTPRFVMVGDYLFDATINGVMDSAEVASDIIVADILERRRAHRQEQAIGTASPAGALNEALGHVQELMSVQCIADILKATWGLEPGARLLHVGSGAGQMVAALRGLGFDVTGVECNREASLAAPAELAQHNFCNDFIRLPFQNEQFDAVIETGLYRTPPHHVRSAIAELHRVTKHGVLLGSVTTDLTIELIERFNLLEGAQVLSSRWDWAEKLYTAGFAHALFDPSRLGAAWEKAEAAGAAPGPWYEDSESLLYCVYERASKPDRRGLNEVPAAEARPDEMSLGSDGPIGDIVAMQIEDIPADVDWAKSNEGQ
ncbi:FAD-dependent oxidoreductase [Desertibaculum subflavum]|uniref:FAD-dependent oxidoreductase n=1 Tax=Desertibaculum subflavum TaxID=2268458 RepID=UPI000E65FC94